MTPTSARRVNYLKPTGTGIKKVIGMKNEKQGEPQE